VIEPLKGKLVTYDNPLGILTNSPTFDWHMTNLRNYINLRAANVAPIKVDHLTLAPFGEGSGMVGLPGDFTPPSRFVRSFVFCRTALPVDTAEQTVFQAFHILNQFDIPVGVARSVGKDGIHADFTQATCVRDPKSLKYYFKTYQDQTVRFIDLSRFDVHAKNVKIVSTSGTEKFIDISKELK
jgi:choloylglycine hydrolase